MKEIINNNHLKKTTYVYHYCAGYWDDSQQVLIDGIYHSDEMILGMEYYADLKELISREHAGKLSVHSLSLLHVMESV